MTWNHRVIVTEEGGEKSYRIHEVFYDEDGNALSWTEQAIAPFGESVNGLLADLDLIRSALFRPTLVIRQGEAGDGRLEPSDEEEAPSIDAYHRHEALDRAFVCTEQFVAHVANHPVIRANASLSELSTQIEEKLGELYQSIGQLE